MNFCVKALLGGLFHGSFPLCGLLHGGLFHGDVGRMQFFLLNLSQKFLLISCKEQVFSHTPNQLAVIHLKFPIRQNQPTPHKKESPHREPSNKNVPTSAYLNTF